jgi:hypothetical protein
MRPAAKLLALAVLPSLALAAPADAVRRRAFVTSVTGPGDLGSWPDAGASTGLAAGDAICRARAAAASLPNANSFRAWLSTASTDAYCHVQGLTGHRSPGCTGGPPQAAGPWYRFTFPASAPAFGDLDELTGAEAAVYRSALFDEDGMPIDGSTPPWLYWTGTDTDGAVYPDFHCEGWTSGESGELAVSGDTTGTAQVWTLTSAAACSASFRLLCLEPGASDPADVGWTAPGSIVFITSASGNANLGSWPQAGGATGVAAGDAVCRGLAAAAHLPAPSSFVAWLSDAKQDAADRLTSNGPFRRIDGVTVATNRAALLGGSNEGSIHQYETGGYLAGQGGGYAFTGTLDDGTAAAERCSDWTSASSDDTGLVGRASSTQDEEWTNYSGFGCNTPFRLHCFSNVVTLFWDGFDRSGDTSRWSSVVP